MKPTTKPPPHSLEVEAAALGCVILAAEREGGRPNAHSLIAQLGLGLFYEPKHQVIFQAMAALAASGMSTDAVTIAQWLKDKKRLADAGGAAYIGQLPEKTPSEWAFPAHLATLTEKLARREALDYARQVLAAANDEAKDPAALARALADLSPVLANGHRNGQREWITFQSPAQCKAWKPPANWILVGDCHVTRGDITILAGPPGCGKSRSLNTLAIAGARGKPGSWLGMPVQTQFKTMICQAENGLYRLRQDWFDFATPNLEEHVRVCDPPPYGFQFGNPEFRAALAAKIEQWKPDVVAVDPWNRVSGDDGAADFTTALDQLRSVCAKLKNPPAFVIVHHFKKSDGSERYSVRGLLEKLSGSYTLGAAARCVIGMIHASDEAAEDRVVVKCCKNNNGQLGEPGCWQRRGSDFVKVEEFDWAEFERPPEPGGRRIEAADVQAVFTGGRRLTRKAAVAELCQPPHNFRHSAAYAALATTGRFAGNLSETNGLLTWKV